MTDSHRPAPAGSSLDIAMQWAQLPPEHLKIALKALEPELARQHELRLLQERLAAEERRERRSHSLYLGGLICGFTLAAAMLTGAVVVGINGLPWLAAMLAGPSVLSLAALFVLRRTDAVSARETARAHRAALAAAQPPQPLPQPGQGTGSPTVPM
ncbi:hypothetical protein NX801_27910 [Streptomyces sp. LP05-1]|uniref:Holin-X, holin superfamily III n=1 Tax=Streptomyces pyxinae TaxID=2970734 RepID=A0ABT2CPM9_9ACTN|nr:hypothetical protein [Streptomyces sp. LP05-1]MCS0639393.1 hypothetical protein [Streptomyces sp. LP05-1]